MYKSKLHPASGFLDGYTSAAKNHLCITMKMWKKESVSCFLKSASTSAFWTTALRRAAMG